MKSCAVCVAKKVLLYLYSYLALGSVITKPRQVFQVMCKCGEAIPF